MLQNLWRNSIAFRRMVAVLLLGLAALTPYLASNIPQSVPLPNSSLDQLAAAHTAEHLRILKPRIDANGPVLSFEGAANVSAEVWVDNATLAGSSTRFASLAPPGSVRAIYAEDGGQGVKTSSDCRTEITISRADGSNAPQTLDLWQNGADSTDPKLRQAIVSSSETAMVVEVSTNSPDPAKEFCPRMLTMGAASIPIPAGPVDLLVQPDKTITLLFSSVDPAVPAWNSKHSTFDGLSLGDGSLIADGVDITSIVKPNPQLLHVLAHKGTNGITLHDLKLGTEQVSLSVGVDTEKADAWTNGRRFLVFDLVDKIQKNPLLGYLLAAVVIPGFWVWIKKTCFPPKRKARRRAVPKPEAS